ncbi:hypothetical protein GPNCGGLF_LOCUS2143 [Methylorubrum aminovorans]
MACLNFNGVVHEIDAEPDTPLLWVIREQIGLTGTKYGCGIAQCGACTVHVDGAVVRACSVPLSSVEPEQTSQASTKCQNAAACRVHLGLSLGSFVPECSLRCRCN